MEINNGGGEELKHYGDELIILSRSIVQVFDPFGLVLRLWPANGLIAQYAMCILTHFSV